MVRVGVFLWAERSRASVSAQAPAVASRECPDAPAGASVADPACPTEIRGEYTCIAEMRAEVESLNHDKERIHAMTAWDHLAWAENLPRVAAAKSISPQLRETVEAATRTDTRDLHNRREAALDFWRERARMTAPAWSDTFSQLPEGIQVVLAGKNLHVFVRARTRASREARGAAMAG
jgi:hypothetical protein